MNEQGLNIKKINLFIEIQKIYKSLSEDIDKYFYKSMLSLQQNGFYILSQLRNPHSISSGCQCQKFKNANRRLILYGDHCNLPSSDGIFFIIACDHHQKEIETSNKWLILTKSIYYEDPVKIIYSVKSSDYDDDDEDPVKNSDDDDL